MSERIAFYYRRESGSSVRVLVSDQVDASDALDTLEAFIAMKRKELTELIARTPAADRSEREGETHGPA